MTTPTQAQIEALELIDTFAWSCVKTDCEESRVELQRRIDKCRAALTAAAEAGPITCLDIKMATECAVAATIERCAQVAEGFDVGYAGEQIAAAIRAMKEEG